MSNIKISEMTEASSLGDSDLLTIVQGGVNKKITKTNAIGNIITALNNPTYVTGSGTSSSLSNTRVGEMSILPKGNTEQTTYTGKNQINGTLANLKTSNTEGTWSGNVYSWNGVTFTINDDLSVTVGGTFSQRAYLYLNSQPQAIENTSYILSGCPSGGTGATYNLVYGLYSNGSWTSGGADNGLTITIDATSTNTPSCRFYIDIRSSAGIGKTFYPMLRLANITNGTYEPYVGRNAKSQSFISSKNTNCYWRK